MSIEDQEKERKIQEYIAKKSKFVGSREFEGNGKILIFNSNGEKLNPNGKFGEVMEYEVKELSGVTRTVTAGAVSLLIGIRTKLRDKPKGSDVKLHVRKTGAGTQPYIVEYAN